MLRLVVRAYQIWCFTTCPRPDFAVTIRLIRACPSQPGCSAWWFRAWRNRVGKPGCRSLNPSSSTARKEFPLLKLKRLQILGFKSFSDRTELKFHGDGIAAIIGPNGCGKSNI